jgi:hypothetical protein
MWNQRTTRLCTYEAGAHERGGSEACAGAGSHYDSGDHAICMLDSLSWSKCRIYGPKLVAFRRSPHALRKKKQSGWEIEHKTATSARLMIGQDRNQAH